MDKFTFYRKVSRIVIIGSRRNRHMAQQLQHIPAIFERNFNNYINYNDTTSDQRQLLLDALNADLVIVVLTPEGKIDHTTFILARTLKRAGVMVVTHKGFLQMLNKTSYVKPLFLKPQKSA